MEIPDEQTEVADIRTEIPDTCMESPDTRLKNILYFQQLRAVIHRLKGIEDSLLAFLKTGPTHHEKPKKPLQFDWRR